MILLLYNPSFIAIWYSVLTLRCGLFRARGEMADTQDLGSNAKGDIP